MKTVYSEEALATAIEILIEIVKPHLTDNQFDKICDENVIIDEVNLFGPKGPCGLGLGRYGGHAV